MPSITINLCEDKKLFLITGDIDVILANRRLTVSLRRLSYSKNDSELAIPYSDISKIKVLQEMYEIFKKYDVLVHTGIEAKNSLDNFFQEQTTFNKFSQQAKHIRNYKFNELEQDDNFIKFHQTVSSLFRRKLENFQWLSAFHMAFAQNSCNFSVPGAGKTTIVYATYAYLKSLNNIEKNVDKLVVVGPISSFAPWENEYLACFGKKINSQRIYGEVHSDEIKQHLASGNPAELTLISYESLPSYLYETANFIKNFKVMLVVDEAHRIKRYKGTYANSVLEIGKGANSRIVLTGTPIPNGYEDLYNLFQFIYPYHYKDILKFHRGNLEEMTQNGELESDRVNQLVDNISPFFVRIKKDHMKLPLVEEKVIPVKMDSYQREIYDFIEDKYIYAFRKDSSATVKDILNKAKLIRLRQTSTNPSLLLEPIENSLDEEDGMKNKFINSQEKIGDIEIFKKIENYKTQVPNKYIGIKQLLEVEVLPKNQKVIIWTIFIKNAQLLQQYLFNHEIQSRLLLGYVEQSERERIIECFNNPADISFQVVIANPFTVAESISLHKGCHNAIYLERDYNCGNFLQSKDRIHRVGLKPDQITKYYYFLSEKSIDEVIDEKLSLKIKRMSKVIDNDIPLLSILEDDNETDLIAALIEHYDKRNS